MHEVIAVLRRYWQNRRTQSLAWLFLLFVPTASRVTNGDPQVQYLSLGIYALSAAGWALVVLRRRLPIVLPRFSLPLFAYVGWMLILLPRSPVRSHAWEIMLDLAQLSALSLMLFTLFPTVTDPKPLRDSLLALGMLFSLGNLINVGVALASWGAVIAKDGQIPPFGYRLPGEFLGHANIEAGFLNLLLPFVLVGLIQANRAWQKLRWGGLMAVFLIVEYFTSSRAGWAAGAAGLLATGLVWFATQHHARRLTDLLEAGFRFLRQRWPAIVALSTLLVGAWGLLWFQAANTPHRPLVQARSAVWSAGWAIFRDAPILGHGPGSTHLLVMTADRFKSESYFIHPHNLLLYLADEGGIVALLMALAAVALLARFLWRAHAGFSVHDRPLEAAGIGALVTVAVHNQADILFEVPVYTVAVLLILVLVWSKRLSEQPSSIVTLSPLVVLPLIAAALIGQALLLRGVREIQTGVEMYVSGEQVRGAEVLCHGAEVQSRYAEGHFQCGLALAHNFSLTGNPSDLQRSIQSFEAGLAQDPFWPTNWANLAVLQWQAGYFDGAIASMTEAVDRAPNDLRLLATQGWMLEHQGKRTDAQQAYERALEFNPALVQSVYLLQTDLRRQAVLSVSEFQYRNRTEELALKGWTELNDGAYDEAAVSFSTALQLTPRAALARSGLAVTEQALGHESQAHTQADFALLASPDNPRTLLAAGRIAAQQGRLPEARNLFEAGWNRLSTRNDSIRYIGIVYRRAYLPFDSLAGLIDPTLTVDMAQALERYAELLRSESQLNQAAQIDRYLQLQRNGPAWPD